MRNITLVIRQIRRFLAVVILLSNISLPLQAQAVKGTYGADQTYGSLGSPLYGVYGKNSNSQQDAGVSGTGHVGVVGGTLDSTAGQIGIYGIANDAGQYGVYGFYGNNLGVGYGVYGYSPISGWAGYFSGDLKVTGTLYKNAGAFQIDHPLAPLDMYLQHSFVESNEMKNIYDGNVTLDRKGEAVVELPAWFEALNKDFRYQLTCIGEHAPVYIAEKISANHFRIAGGYEGMEVSWQVTGVRRDPYALAHPIVVEKPKPPEERGRLIHPELYGMPESAGIDYEKTRPATISREAIQKPKPKTRS